MKSIIFIAPPAAGKGTQSDLLKNYYHIPHISVGDLLREVATHEDDLGRTIREVQKQGGLVDDNVVTEILKQRISQPDCDNGYILDGYPRNEQQMLHYEAMLNEMNKELGYVIFLDIDRELATKRMLGRLNCPNCGATYNEYFEEVKPQEPGICDRCHHKLQKRHDDNEESFKIRFDIYENLTKTLLDHYKKNKNFKTIHCDNLSKQEIFDTIREILEGQND